MLLARIEKALRDGFPTDGENVVKSPHLELMGAGADNICVFAKTVQHMIQNVGMKIEALRKPEPEAYRKVINHIKHDKDKLSFNGVSGTVAFTQNDKPGRLGLWQIKGNSRATVGNVSAVGSVSVDWTQGLGDTIWTEAYPDPEEPPFQWLYIIIPFGVSLIVCPCVIAVYTEQFGGCSRQHLYGKGVFGATKDKGQDKKDNRINSGANPGSEAAA